MHIHCFQHVPFETPGVILEWLKEHRHSITYTKFFEKEYVLPKPGDYDCLVIMGGYVNVDEEQKFPWLAAEKQAIKNGINAEKKVIGICLGSQLIAAALGEKVYKGKEKEIGFLPVYVCDDVLKYSLFDHFPKEYTVFHWHGNTFDLPAHAELIASTTACTNQAFIIKNKVLGFQFHFEMSEAIIEDMIRYCGKELLEKGSYIQSAAEIRQAYHLLPQLKKDIFLLLDKFFST